MDKQTTKPLLFFPKEIDFLGTPTTEVRLLVKDTDKTYITILSEKQRNILMQPGLLFDAGWLSQHFNGGGQAVAAQSLRQALNKFDVFGISPMVLKTSMRNLFLESIGLQEREIDDYREAIITEEEVVERAQIIKLLQNTKIRKAIENKSSMFLTYDHEYVLPRLLKDILIELKNVKGEQLYKTVRSEVAIKGLKQTTGISSRFISAKIFADDDKLTTEENQRVQSAVTTLLENIAKGDRISAFTLEDFQNPEQILGDKIVATISETMTDQLSQTEETLFAFVTQLQFDGYKKIYDLLRSKTTENLWGAFANMAEFDDVAIKLLKEFFSQIRYYGKSPGKQKISQNLMTAERMLEILNSSTMNTGRLRKIIQNKEKQALLLVALDEYFQNYLPRALEAAQKKQKNLLSGIDAFFQQAQEGYAAIGLDQRNRAAFIQYITDEFDKYLEQLSSASKLYDSSFLPMVSVNDSSDGQENRQIDVEYQIEFEELSTERQIKLAQQIQSSLKDITEEIYIFKNKKLRQIIIDNKLKATLGAHTFMLNNQNLIWEDRQSEKKTVLTKGLVYDIVTRYMFYALTGIAMQIQDLKPNEIARHPIVLNKIRMRLKMNEKLIHFNDFEVDIATGEIFDVKNKAPTLVTAQNDLIEITSTIGLAWALISGEKGTLNVTDLTWQETLEDIRQNFHNVKADNDQAMISQQEIDPALITNAVAALPTAVEEKKVGGIDLKDIRLQNRGAPQQIIFDTLTLENLKETGVSGFTPVILDLVPIREVAPLF